MLFIRCCLFLKIRQANLKRNHVCLRCFSYSVVKEPTSDRVGSMLKTTLSFSPPVPRMDDLQPVATTCYFNCLLLVLLRVDRVGMAVNWKERVVISAGATVSAEPAGFVARTCDNARVPRTFPRLGRAHMPTG